MNSTKAKTGRKTKPHKTSWGDTIDGLYKCPDGRWRICATGQKFTERDERLAVLHFRRWQAKQKGGSALIELPIPPHDPDPDISGAVDFTIRHELGEGDHHAPGDDSLILRIGEDQTTTLIRSMHEVAVWAWFRQQLIDHPKYVAEQVGIEQIGYLADLPKPTPSPSLDDVGALFFKKKLSENWMAKCKAFWSEFVEFVDVKTLREVNQDHLLDYEAMVLEAVRDGSHEATYARQRYQAVKSIINYPPKRGKWAVDAATAYAFCKVLIPPEQSDTDPHPIDREHFHSLMKHADEQLWAMLLLMLNACMYGGEVAAVNWSEINFDNGTLTTRRNKTGIIRIAVLWDRTIDALKKLPRITDACFITSGTKMVHNYQTLHKAFRTVRETAGLIGQVQLSHIRDGSYTAAVEAGITLDRCQLLAGHSSGISDHYVKRSPKMVADACSAIERHYFG